MRRAQFRNVAVGVIVVTLAAVPTALAAGASQSDSSLPDRIPEDAADRIEKVFELTEAMPNEWAGGWYDQERQQVVVGLSRSATASTRTTADEIVAGRGRVEPQRFSAAELFAERDRLVMQREAGETQINGVGLSWSGNGLRVGVEKFDAEVETIVRARSPLVSTVFQMQRPTVTVDYDRWRDRPAWNGASGYSWSDDLDETLPACSTAFPMTKSGGQKILITAGHCTSQYVNHAQIVNAAALDFNETSWSYDIGSSSGQPNSLCASTGNSCDSAGGGVKRGDLGAFTAPSIAPSIFTGGPRGTTKASIVSAQTGLPAVSDDVCLSAARTGTHCEYYVTDNSMGVWVNIAGTTDTVLFSPMIQTTNAEWCPQGGDSGGAVYREVTGGVRASGVQSSAGLDENDSSCVMYYTHITRAVALFNATVLTN